MGLNLNREQDRGLLLRDTRTFGEKTQEFLTNKNNLAVALGITGLLTPFAVELGVTAFACLAMYGIHQVKNKGLPLLYPKSSGLIDPNELHPATGKPQRAEGTYYFGTDRRSKQELWLSDTNMRTHALFMGTTGSGKAQPITTPVATPGGWRCIGDLKAGDKVLHRSGSLSTVISTHPQGYLEQYRIQVMHQDQRLSTSACPDHLWRVRVRERSDKPQSIETLTTTDLLERLQDKQLLELPVCLTMRGEDAPGLSLSHEREQWAVIKKVAKAGPQMSTCIKLDADDSLYVVRADEGGDWGICTHNTEFLLSTVYNALIQGSGFIYIDGKGDAKTYRSIYSMARAMGRDDDVLLVNYQTGAKDVIGAQTSKLSNTTNLFAVGSSGMVSQAFMSLIASGKEDVWSERANSFIEGLVKPLVFLRDHYNMALDISVVRNYFSLPHIEALVYLYPSQYPGLDDCTSGLRSYFDNLPAWSLEKSAVMEWLDNFYQQEALRVFKKEYKDLEVATPDGKAALRKIAISLFKSSDFEKAAENGFAYAIQNGVKVPAGHPTDTMLQHGYITMQLVRTSNSLADTYGYIMRTGQAEVDMPDVFLNRRILMVLLPALEKSAAELSNLGKINVATIKATFAIGLGGTVEGESRRIIDSRSTNARSAFPAIHDEYGLYAVKGYFVVPAQARSLGASAIFAGQDLPAFQKTSKEEADSTLANTNLKLFGKLECSTTYEYLNKLAGEGRFTTMQGFDSSGSSIAGGSKFLDKRETSVQSMSRLAQEDLRSHTSGSWHLLFGKAILHIKSFYANPRTVELLRVNHFIKVPRPTKEQASELTKGRTAFHAALNGSGFASLITSLSNSEADASSSEPPFLTCMRQSDSVLSALHGRLTQTQLNVERKFKRVPKIAKLIDDAKPSLPAPQKPSSFGTIEEFLASTHYKSVDALTQAPVLKQFLGTILGAMAYGQATLYAATFKSNTADVQPLETQIFMCMARIAADFERCSKVNGSPDEIRKGAGPKELANLLAQITSNDWSRLLQIVSFKELHAYLIRIECLRADFFKEPFKKAPTPASNSDPGATPSASQTTASEATPPAQQSPTSVALAPDPVLVGTPATSVIQPLIEMPTGLKAELTHASMVQSLVEQVASLDSHATDRKHLVASDRESIEKSTDGVKRAVNRFASLVKEIKQQ